MSNIPSIGIPPLGGLATYEEAARIGFAVDENVELLRRYQHVKKRLNALSSAFMNPTPEWEVKCALSLHMWLDAEHAQAMRDRVAELRRPPLYLDKVPDERLDAMLEELFRSQNTIELLAGVFAVVRPALVRAYKTHLEKSNPLFDHPTCRVLRQALAEEEQMVAWGTEALDAVAKTDQDRQTAIKWQSHLKAFLEAAGGIQGTDTVPEGLELPEARAKQAFEPSFDPQRDWRSREIYNFHYRPSEIYNDEKASIKERTLALMYKRFHEMDVPEMMSSIIYETQGKPWDYYREMSRQLWDEARHAMMGEVWFAKNGIDWSRWPNHVGWAMHLNLDHTPIERHIILYGIEQSLMDGKVGKKYEWKVAQEANDPLATFFQDYDWADEVLHAQIGRRWLKPDFGSVKEMMDLFYKLAEAPKTSLLKRERLAEQIDWWPDFVREAIGQESTATVKKENPLIPRFAKLESG